MTRPRALAALVPAVLAIGALSSCSLANPDRSSDARDLIVKVRALPGVASAHAKYNKPITLQSGNLDLKVRMADDATGAQVVAVGRTAYAAFRSSLSDSETDLHLSVGADKVHIRGFEPRADVADVADELTVVTGVFAQGAVSADINTQDVSSGRKLTDTIDLQLTVGSTVADLQPALTQLRRTNPDDAQRGWGVRAATGAGLHPDFGFPSVELAAHQAQLTALGGAVTGRATIGVDLVERRGHGFEGLTTTTLTGRSGALDLADPEVRNEVIALGERQMDALPDDKGGFIYGLDVDGHSVASVDANICLLEGGPISRALNRYQFHLAVDQKCPA